MYVLTEINRLYERIYSPMVRDYASPRSCPAPRLPVGLKIHEGKVRPRGETFPPPPLEKGSFVTKFPLSRLFARVSNNYYSRI